VCSEERCGAVNDLFLGARRKKNGKDDFLVLCADNYFDFPLEHFLLQCLSHEDSGFIGVYNVNDKEKASLYGIVSLDGHGKVLNFEEQTIDPLSTLASIGVYYFPRHYSLRIYEYLHIKKFDPDRIGDFIEWLIDVENLYGVEFDGAWFDAGDIDSYEELRKLFDPVGVLTPLHKNHEIGKSS